MKGKESKVVNEIVKRVFLVTLFIWITPPTVPHSAQGDENIAEREDDIVCAFFYGWWGNIYFRQSPEGPGGGWEHWQEGGKNPPVTWSANYIPNFPNSKWNPNTQLYDSWDTNVLKWQDKAMARAGIDIAISSWWVPNNSTDRTLAKAIRMCKSVQWCIYYEPEGYGDPPPQRIYNDIKYVIDNYGSSRNYAKINGKWLVFVYIAQNSANRWREAKAMLAADGYDVYLNADIRDSLTSNHPWDGIHRYHPTVHREFSDTDVDDSTWISPGYWVYGRERPVLERSLSKFKSAWSSAVRNKEDYRFILLETWNEWHEGTQIEPGQEIVPDSSGYYPSGYDYGYDFIDAIGSTAANELHWESSGHRPIVPVRLQSEEMIWDNDEKVLAEGGTACKILESDIRIGSSIFVPCSNEITFTIKARADLVIRGRQFTPAKMALYIDDLEANHWDIDFSIDPNGVAQSDYHDFNAVIYVPKGIHKLEVTMLKTPTIWNLVVDFIDVNAPNCGNSIELEEGFETGDFSKFDWEFSGDADWKITSGEKNSGSYSAQAGSIEDEERSSLNVTLDCISGDISFYCKVSSESGYDYLRFYIDGAKKDEWSGEQNWTEVSFPVTEGTRTFTWTYSKDSSVSGGDDTSWIDDIVFPGN